VCILRVGASAPSPEDRSNCHIPCRPYTTKEQCTGKTEIENSKPVNCIWAKSNINSNEEACIIESSINDCGQYINSNTCNEKEINEKICEWGNGKCNGILWTCNKYNDKNECDSNERNINEGCAWSGKDVNNGICKIKSEISCNDFNNISYCGNGKSSENTGGLNNCIWAKSNINSNEEVCITESSINDCGQYIDSNTCNEKEINGKTCEWDNNQCNGNLWTCNKYKDKNECDSNERNIKEGCAWSGNDVNNGICKIKSEIICNDFNNILYCGNGKASENTGGLSNCIWAKSNINSNEEACIIESSINDCGQYINSNTCNEKEINEKTCEWDNNNFICVFQDKNSSDDSDGLGDKKSMSRSIIMVVVIVVAVLVVIAIVVTIFIVLYRKRKQKSKKQKSYHSSMIFYFFYLFF
jgi:hypothetical protein